MKQLLRREAQPATPTKTGRVAKVATRENPAKRFFGEIRAELSKVTWPGREQTTNLTLLVIAVSAVVGMILGAVDYLFQQLFEFILGIGRL